MSNTHGPVMARQAKTILRGGLQLAVMANCAWYQPGSRCAKIKSKRPPKGAPALTADQLRDLLARLRASEYCREHDLVDPFTLFIATGLRRCELLGLRWCDFAEAVGRLAVTGKVVRIAGKGLIRVDETKTTAGRRTLALPSLLIRFTSRQPLRQHASRVCRVALTRWKRAGTIPRSPSPRACARAALRPGGRAR